jgi:hypothetical protein
VNAASGGGSQPGPIALNGRGGNSSGQSQSGSNTSLKSAPRSGSAAQAVPVPVPPSLLVFGVCGLALWFVSRK